MRILDPIFKYRYPISLWMSGFICSCGILMGLNGFLGESLTCFGMSVAMFLLRHDGEEG